MRKHPDSQCSPSRKICRASSPTAPARTCPTADVDEDDPPAVILFTSGTSGRPKGAVHSQRNLLAVVDYHRFSDALVAQMYGRTYDDSVPSESRYLLTSPLFHIASLHNLTVPRLATGSAVVMTEGGFDVDKVFGLIERERVTNWGCRSDDGRAHARAPGHRPLRPVVADRVRAGVGASSPRNSSSGCEPSSVRAAGPGGQLRSHRVQHRRRGRHRPPELEAFPGTLGRPILTVALEIRDLRGSGADGAEGEVCVRSPFVMLGYWEDEPATAAALTSDGWLRTGDYGVVENGRLRLTGRRSDLILRGGENVYPTEVEQCLEEHPAVHECAVIGVDHADLGQEVAAVVVLRAGHDASEDELREFCRDRISYYKVPSQWKITRDLLPPQRNRKGLASRRGGVNRTDPPPPVRVFW